MNLFKLIRITYRVVLIALMVAAFTALFVYGTDGGVFTLERAVPVFAVYLVCCLVLELAYVVSERAALKRIVAILDEKCDPEAFLAETESLRISKREHRPNSALILQRRGLAFCETGDTVSAERLVPTLERMFYQERSKNNAAEIVGWLCELLALLGEREKLSKYLEELRSLLSSRFIQEDIRRRLRRYVALEEDRERYSAADDAQAMAALYNSVYEDAAPGETRVKVKARFEQAQWYEKLGSTSDMEAREIECLEYVFEHGNKLPCVEKARERLDVIASKDDSKT